MIVPGFDVILLVFIGFSVLIWLGVFRKWAVRERQGDVYAPAIPWMTLGFVIMRVVLFLAQLGVPIPSIPIPGLPFPGKVTLVLAPLLLGPAIGVWASIVRRPRWLLPPWYHEYREKHFQREKNEGKQ